MNVMYVREWELILGSKDLNLSARQFARMFSWALVMLCSHGEEVLGDNLDFLIEELKKIIHQDQNVITFGFAMDALCRLAHLRVGEEAPSTSIIALRADLATILNSSPIQCWESLVRSGLRPASPEAVQH